MCLEDVARVERGSAENHTFFRGNGVPMVGIGIVEQSTANTIEVTSAAKAEVARISPNPLPGMAIKQGYDTSVFVEGAIAEVYKTLIGWLFLRFGGLGDQHVKPGRTGCVRPERSTSAGPQTG